MLTIKKDIFISKDWKEFDTEDECIEYEKSLLKDTTTFTTYLHADKWQIYEQLKEDWIHFNEEDDELMWRVKYILNEVEIQVELNIKTGKYKISLPPELSEDNK